MSGWGTWSLREARHTRRGEQILLWGDQEEGGCWEEVFLQIIAQHIHHHIEEIWVWLQHDAQVEGKWLLWIPSRDQHVPLDEGPHN